MTERIMTMMDTVTLRVVTSEEARIRYALDLTQTVTVPRTIMN
jgi:hypothetical protein